MLRLKSSGSLTIALRTLKAEQAPFGKYFWWP